MTLPPVSIVVASWQRPKWLARCVTSLLQLDYPRYEIVPVADAEGLAALERLATRERIVPVANPGDGVAAARNAGVSAAAGEIVAFIDDDSAAEPLWLRHLVGAFDDGRVSAATGHVLGRNGISIQWGGRAVDRAGRIRSLGLRGDAPVVPDCAPGEAVMLEGTNMAVRRSALVRAGGFDSAFSFLFDDADMALRLTGDDRATAVVPLAQVHHAFAGSSRRRHDRTPTDLFEIGRSLAIFLRKHDGDRPPEGDLIDRRDAERRRLVRAMVDGRLMPGDVGRLLETFDAGACAGLTATHDLYADLVAQAPDRSIPELPCGQRLVLSGAWHEADRVRAAAAEAARQGAVPTVILLSPTALYHRVRYDPRGFWEQRGGRFGRSVRSEAVFRRVSSAARVAGEVARVAKVRGIGDSARGDE